MRSSGSLGDAAFHAVMHKAVDEHDLTWADIAARLSRRGHLIGVERLRSWCYGGALPTSTLERTSVPALESVLSLPARQLSSLLPPSSVTQPAAMLRPADDDIDAYAELTHRLGRPQGPSVRTVDYYGTVTIGPQRQLLQNQVRHLILATTSGSDGLVIWYQSEEPQGTPYLEPVRNCHVGRVVDMPHRSLLAYDLRFNRVLAAGESAYLEYVSGCVGPPTPETYWEYTPLGPLRELHIEVQFTPGVLPKQIETYTTVDGVEKTRPATIGSTGSVSYLELDFGPGTAGLRWNW